MLQKVITTSGQLATWLEEHHWFVDCHLLDMQVDDASGQPITIAFELGQPIAGSYAANDELTLRVFALTAFGLKVWHIPKLLHFGIDTCLQGVGSEAVNQGVRIEIGDNLMVHCSQLRVKQLPDRIEIVPPKPNEGEFSATIEDQHLPTPSDWIEWFSQHGENVVWRMYGEPARAPDQVPKGDYEGWFLQREDAVATTMQGLFISYCRTRGSGFFLRVQDSQTSKLWTVMGKIVGRFSRVVVRSGNCRFNRREWLEYLD